MPMIAALQAILDAVSVSLAANATTTATSGHVWLHRPLVVSTVSAAASAHRAQTVPAPTLFRNPAFADLRNPCWISVADSASIDAWLS